MLESWLRGLLGRSDQAIPPADLIDHLQNCPRCRGTLLALVADLCGPLEHPIDLPCDAVEDQLPALVDYERLHGTVAAARIFPSVWWHCLACPSCGALYADLRELAELAHEPWLAAPPQPALQQQLRFRPAAVRRLIAANQQMGVAWGQQADRLITEYDDDAGELRLYLRQPHPAEIALVLRSAPALAGMAQLSIAGASYSSALAPDGSAVFAGLDEALFGGDGDAAVTITSA